MGEITQLHKRFCACGISYCFIVCMDTVIQDLTVIFYGNVILTHTSIISSPKMVAEQKTIVLSRHFHSNVVLIAGVCPKCYEEQEVKITAVNERFLNRKIAIKNEIVDDELELHKTTGLEDKIDMATPESKSTIRNEDEFDFDVLTPPDSQNKIIEGLDEGCLKPKINLCRLSQDGDMPSILTPPDSQQLNRRKRAKHNTNRKPRLKTLQSHLSDDYVPPGSQKPLWSPPKSPHGLLEEDLYQNPWSLLVATIFLNKTSCMVARPYVERFLEDFPGPDAVLQKKPEELECYFENIGLKKRAWQVWKMTDDFVNKKWTDVGELFGIGRYGRDAFILFCLGDLEHEPADRFLKIYRAWYLQEEERKKREIRDDG